MKINQIQGSVEHALGYKVILCDLWGVIHNGKALFQHSISFLEHMKENNIKVIFLSHVSYRTINKYILCLIYIEFTKRESNVNDYKSIN